ncbi:MAG: cupin domain-containing protein [Archangium sp.]
MTADPLADVLAILRPQALLAAEVSARGRWGLRFDASPDDLKFGFVAEGECVIALRGRKPTTLRAGDVFLLGGAPPYVIASDVSAPSQNASAVLHRTGVVRLGSGKTKPVRVIGGRFALDPANAHLLVRAVPPLVRIPAGDAAALRSVTQLLIDEVRSRHSARGRALDQLAQLVLTYALRWLDSDGKTSGLLRALADAQIGAALRHIHATVEKGTSLPELARIAGMSRATFAERFKALVGQPPLAYAIEWKISLAKDALRTTD